MVRQTFEQDVASRTRSGFSAFDAQTYVMLFCTDVINRFVPRSPVRVEKLCEVITNRRREAVSAS
jgi:hypothetical protein